MQQFYYSYGCQLYCELERPDIIVKPGAKAEIVGKKYNLLVKPSGTKVLIKPSTISEVLIQ